MKFTTLTSGNDTNEEAIATSSPTFTIGLFDAAGSGTVTGKKLYFSLTTNAADADDNTVASPGSDFTALTDVGADWISIDKASNLTAQTATVTLDIIDDATDEENQNVTVTLGIKGADFNGGKLAQLPLAIMRPHPMQLKPLLIIWSIPIQSKMMMILQC